MSTVQRSAVALLVILALATVAIGYVTRGFGAITTDGARRIDLMKSPKSLPDLPLVNSTGRFIRLSALGAPGKLTLVTLFYAHCETICRVGTSGQSYLQNEIRSRGLAGQIRLLTISFDPRRDTAGTLAEYAHRNRADPELWTVATVARPADLQVMLAAFGVVVLPDEWGGYSHNAALFLVDSRGKLAYAYDVNRPDDALADLLEKRQN
jgi:protein SCO1/2